MAGAWFVQVHPLTGPAHNKIYFDDFAATLSFVKKFKTLASADVLKVHAPLSATRKELDELTENGCFFT
jgi:hypothetical protein